MFLSVSWLFYAVLCGETERRSATMLRQRGAGAHGLQPAHASLARPGLHPDPVDPHASIGRLIEAFDEVLDLRPPHPAWPWPPGRRPSSWPAGSAPRRRLLRSDADCLTSPGSGGSSAPVPSMVDPERGARCAIRVTGAAGPARYHWTVTVFEETGPAAAGVHWGACGGADGG